MAFWAPQIGPQTYAATCPVDYIFFGGSRGGGKSDCLIGRQVRGSEKYSTYWNGLVIRRKYKDFAEIRRRIDGMIAKGLPAVRIGGDQQINVVRFANGATITLAAIMTLAMADSLQGQQFTEISIDEAPTIPFISQLIEKLKGCLRSPAGVPCRMFMTGNPGGPGHAIIKGLFIDPNPQGNKVLYDSAGESYIFIPSGLSDNKILCQNDPKYVRRLQSIKDPALRKAWLDGDWDVFIGQAFTFLPEHHIIEPIPIPSHAPLYSTFDWGYGKPFSWGWWFTDNDGRVIRCGEWYGMKPGCPDEGLRLTDAEIATGVLAKEKEMGIIGRDIQRLAGPDCWNKKPDYQGGGQGPSTAEILSQHGVHMRAGDPSRKLKIRMFRDRLWIPRDAEDHIIDRPMLQVFSTCKDFIRTVPSLCMDESVPEDIDTDQEDHIYDEACHIVMARPMKPKVPASPQTMFESRIAAMEAGQVPDWQKGMTAAPWDRALQGDEFTTINTGE